MVWDDNDTGCTGALYHSSAVRVCSDIMPKLPRSLIDSTLCGGSDGEHRGDGDVEGRGSMLV